MRTARFYEADGSEIGVPMGDHERLTESDAPFSPLCSAQDAGIEPGVLQTVMCRVASAADPRTFSVRVLGGGAFNSVRLWSLLASRPTADRLPDLGQHRPTMR